MSANYASLAEMDQHLFEAQETVDRYHQDAPILNLVAQNLEQLNSSMIKRNKKNCAKCDRDISLSNYTRHFETCNGTLFYGPNRPTERKQRVYDWDILQEAYDSGMSYRMLTKEFGISAGVISAAVKRGDLTVRTNSEAVSLHFKTNGPNIMGEEARLRISKAQSANNRGGFCKWYKVAGQKVQGTWERDMALRFEETGVNWYKPRLKKDTWAYTLDGKDRSYSPYFYLPDEDLFIEVKGHWWGNDKNKMKAVMEQHKDKRIVIVEKDDFYKFLEGDQIWQPNNNVTLAMMVHALA